MNDALHCVYNNSLDFPSRIPHYLLMAAASTITQISESSADVWDLVCRHEDGLPVKSRELRALSEADRGIFTEECHRIADKHARAHEYATIETPYNRKPAFRPAAREDGPDYEKMILDADAADSSWWT